MLASDAYRPDEWHDFFITVGGPAAVLTGLVFVAFLRTVSGTTFYVALIAGSVVLLVGATAGLYIAGLAMVTIGVYSVSGAWLLLVGAYGDERERSPH